MVILDLALPKTGNLDLCRRIRKHEQGEDVLILVLTGESSPDSILETLEAGADDYLTKPVDTALFGLRLSVAERELNRRAGYAPNVSVPPPRMRKSDPCWPTSMK